MVANKYSWSHVTRVTEVFGKTEYNELVFLWYLNPELNQCQQYFKCMQWDTIRYYTPWRVVSHLSPKTPATPLRPKAEGGAAGVGGENHGQLLIESALHSFQIITYWVCRRHMPRCPDVQVFMAFVYYNFAMREWHNINIFLDTLLLMHLQCRSKVSHINFIDFLWPHTWWEG